MANSTILQLPQVFALNGSEQVPVVSYLGADPAEPVTVRVASSLLSSGPASSVQDANTIYAGPTSGSAAAPAFRALVDADIPDVLSLTTLTVSGTATVGTLTQTGTIAANLFMAGPTTGSAAAPAYRALVNDDIPSTLSLASLTLSGTLGVTGAATVGSLGTIGAVSAGTLAATGAITGGSATISGAVSGTTGAFPSGLTAGATTVTGTCAATTFSGSGASLTNVPYASLSGTGAANSVHFNSALNTPSTIASAASAVLVTNSSGVPSFSSTLPAITLATGTTSIAPATYVAGTNLGTAVAGSVEYDGKAQYFTPAATNRGVVQAVHFLSLSSDQTGTDGGGFGQNVFAGSGANTITLPGSTTYFFEGCYQIDTTGTNSRTFQVGFGGAATLTSIRYTVVVTNGTTSSIQAPTVTTLTSATLTTVTGSVSAASNNTVWIRGMVRVNTGGTFTPQFGYSSLPGAAPSIRANSFFRMHAVGSNTVLNVGQWS